MDIELELLVTVRVEPSRIDKYLDELSEYCADVVREFEGVVEVEVPRAEVRQSAQDILGGLDQYEDA